MKSSIIWRIYVCSANNKSFHNFLLIYIYMCLIKANNTKNLTQYLYGFSHKFRVDLRKRQDLP